MIADPALTVAHQDALELDILHRDISAGNILFYKIPNTGGEVEGLLIDWDLSLNIKRNSEAHRKGRTVSSLIPDLQSPS